MVKTQTTDGSGMSTFKRGQLCHISWHTRYRSSETEIKQCLFVSVPESTLPDWMNRFKTQHVLDSSPDWSTGPLYLDVGKAPYNSYNILLILFRLSWDFLSSFFKRPKKIPQISVNTIIATHFPTKTLLLQPLPLVYYSYRSHYGNNFTTALLTDTIATALSTGTLLLHIFILEHYTSYSSPPAFAPNLLCQSCQHMGQKDQDGYYAEKCHLFCNFGA